MSIVEISKYKVSVGTDNKNSRRDMTFIRIGTKSTSSYTKATTQYNLNGVTPLIKMRQLSHNFLNSISIYIIETIYWSEDESVYDPEICKKSSSNCSKSSSTSHDNPSILQSIYPILDSLYINTSNFKDKPLDIKYILL